MSRGRIQTVAIVGGGPSGAALATFLAREGLDVTLYTRPSRAQIVIGESLVPAVIPFLRRLGIEDEVASYSAFKPGATYALDDRWTIRFRFEEARGARTQYSYNVPRDRFDRSIVEAARRNGARVLERTARVHQVGQGDRVELDAASLEAAGLRCQPDLVVDATGRARLVSRLLGIPSQDGGRKDDSLFAHMTGVPVTDEGHLHTDRLERGWAWRIPLRDRMSVGLVVDGSYLRKFGDTREEQFDTFLRTEPMCRRWSGDAKRISPVLRYTNYQLRSTRGVGANWALVGDAFGFIDPVFSGALQIAFDTAWQLRRAILSGTPAAFQRYERYGLRLLTAWQRVTDYWYDGRLFTLFRIGDNIRYTTWGRIVDPHFRKHMPRLFTGEATTSRYSLGMLDFMVRYGIYGSDPRELEVR